MNKTVKTAYIVLENGIESKKGKVDIQTRMTGMGVSDEVMVEVRKIQEKMAQEVAEILKEKE